VTPVDQLPVKHMQMGELAGDRDPWLQQPNETDHLFGYFQMFRAMGPGMRSVEAVADLVSRSPVYIARLHSGYKWRARIAAWDAEVGRQFMAQTVESRKLVQAQQLRMAQKLMDKVLTAIEDLNPAKMTPTAIVQAVMAVAEVQRRALGMDFPTPATAVTVATSTPTASGAPDERVEVRVMVERVSRALDDMRGRLSPEQLAAALESWQASDDPQEVAAP
jgi:hypothetical protein